MTTGVRTPTAPQRSRARTFLPLAVAAWLLLEIWLLTLVAGAAGGFTVFALLVAGAVLGGVVIKRAGRRAFRNLTQAFQQQPGAAPTAASGERQTEGNGLLMLGGLLLMLPGLISDAAGLLLLLPPVRQGVGRYAGKSLERRMRQAAPGSLEDALRQARIHQPDGKVVQGEVVREDASPTPPQPGTGQHPPLAP
ncbi:FxsA family membrane protein [Streptomyces sp. SCSIO 30461]|uniref:FxsA family membrane protein n=1 Tax=Streptomyces sp. SCSIO 30461 TaxID=3118085 RepID=UPI0030D1F481